MNKEERRIDATFRKHKVDTVNIVTDEPYELPLKKFFRTRQKRVMY